MKMSKLSNQTNSQDPQAVNSRVFVGNLNTFQCSKTDVERMFQRYGRLAGISMHKGYAFVQFTNPFDARNACHGEDGRTVLSQVLDVNMVAEPKPHQTGRKRQNVTKTGNDWDYYYDSYYASTLFPPQIQAAAAAAAARPIKRQRLMTPPTRTTANVLAAAAAVAQSAQRAQNMLALQQHSAIAQQLMSGSASSNGLLNNNSQHSNNNAPINSNSILNGNCNGTNDLLNGTGMMAGTTVATVASACMTNGQHVVGPFKTYSNPDTLICGNCREMFTDLGELLDHKRTYCKLRFTCKCQDSPLAAITQKSSLPTSKLLCVVCKDSFANPWDLMVHAQAAHMINIYEIGDVDDDKSRGSDQNAKEANGVNEATKDDEMSEIIIGEIANGSEDGDKHSRSTSPQSDDCPVSACIVAATINPQSEEPSNLPSIKTSLALTIASPAALGQ